MLAPETGKQDLLNWGVKGSVTDAFSQQPDSSKITDIARVIP